MVKHDKMNQQVMAFLKSGITCKTSLLSTVTFLIHLFLILESITIVLINNAYADLNVTVGIEMGYLDLLYFHARY